MGPTWRPALLATPHTSSRMRCGLCPAGCTLGEGQTGLCQVRRNRYGVMETATFTISVSHLTNIERKPFYHLRPGAKVLTVAAPGCTFRCDYCINHRLSQYGRDRSASWTGAVADPAALAREAKAAGALIGLSYSEPGLAPELTLALAEHAGPLVWKTNGYLTPAAIDLVAPALLGVNIDIKAADSQAHQSLTGASLGPVLDAVARFRGKGVWVEVSTPLIPGVSASRDQIATIARRLAAISTDLPWHLLRFTPTFRRSADAPTLVPTLAAARDIAHEAGLRYVYVERALGAEGRRTVCPGCGAVLAERGVWETLDVRVESGACPACGREIPGRWGQADG